MKIFHISIIIVILLSVLLFIKTKIKPKKLNTEIKNVDFQKLIVNYGSSIAKNVEKIFRLETAHFKSGGFINTLGAGFEATKNNYPFGWTSLKSFWDKNPQFKPVNIWVAPENKTGIVKKFLIFPSLYASLATVAELLKLRGNDVGKYFSNNETQREIYRQKIAKIKTSYT